MPELFIGGAWLEASDGATREIHCPADGSLVGTVSEATATDATAAVRAARAAFDHGLWPSTPAPERAALLHRLADRLAEEREEVARLESLDTGKRLVEARMDMDDVIGVFRYYAGLADGEAGRVIDTGQPDIVSRVVHEPIGVCALTEAPEVDFVSFTGGLATGRAIMASAAGTVKKVALELGGKNPNIVFADADLDTALDMAGTAIFLDSGQVCSAGARLIVEESIHDEFVAELVRRTRRIRLGGPFDDDTQTGPLISAAHREKVESYVAAGIAEGATLLVGGTRPEGEQYGGGFYYLPTILDGCTSDMTCVQEESFGPVLTVETFSGEDRDGAEAAAVALANDTIYGLAGAVWTQDAGRAERVAARLRHGTVWINDYHPYVPQAEWGGFKQSGVGRELGLAGLAEYREAKHIWHNTRPAPQHWFGAPDGEKP